MPHTILFLCNLIPLFSPRPALSLPFIARSLWSSLSSSHSHRISNSPRRRRRRRGRYIQCCHCEKITTNRPHHRSSSNHCDARIVYVCDVCVRLFGFRISGGRTYNRLRVTRITSHSSGATFLLVIARPATVRFVHNHRRLRHCHHHPL